MIFSGTSPLPTKEVAEASITTVTMTNISVGMMAIRVMTVTRI